MNLPRFTAEASLYNAHDRNYIVASWNPLVSSQVIQPASEEYDICGTCFKTGPRAGYQFCRGFSGGHLIYKGWFLCDT